MAKIEYSPDAFSDLEHIGDYIEQELMSPIAAYNTIDKIQDSIDNLSVFPLMGTQLSTIFDFDSDYRFLVCGNYLAFYRYDEPYVYIDRIIYGKRDYIAILFPGLSLLATSEDFPEEFEKKDK